MCPLAKLTNSTCPRSIIRRMCKSFLEYSIEQRIGKKCTDFVLNWREMKFCRNRPPMPGIKDSHTCLLSRSATTELGLSYELRLSNDRMS
jgi:hypothetical protein